MKYIDEFRNSKVIRALSERIKQIAPSEEMNIMEVCGTHTQSFFRFGVNKLLPQNINLISGPGCPVCVTSQGYIDAAINLAKQKDVILVTFGDMLRIPGTKSSLEKEKAKGADVRMVYSAYESLRIAQQNPDKKIIFLAVGFETTAPTIALSILAAKKQNLKNLFFFSALKLIPAAMEHLLKDKRLKLCGFICPGHVSSIIGTKAYEFIPRKYSIPCCVTGFEPLDMLQGIYMILKQIVEIKPQVANQYMRVVKKGGNLKAKRTMAEVFRPTHAFWRGLGEIPQSGLKIKKEFSRFDAEKVFDIRRTTDHELRTTKCRCGDVLKGLISPSQCLLFAKKCSPDNPIGPCMVSSEGACNAYYRYR